jgi:Putative transposase
VLAVLHTWSQNLGHHPHLHCLVPAGGLALDHSHWVRSKHNFFLPVRVLSRMFRGKLLAFLKQSYRRNELCFSGMLAALSQPHAFHSLLSSLHNKEWVVYSKPTVSPYPTEDCSASTTDRSASDGETPSTTTAAAS